MDGISLAASVVAFVQLADRVIKLCKFYIESIKDAPHNLRLILIEISSLKCALESLEYLLGVDPKFLSQAARNLWTPGGTVEACRTSLAQLEQLFSDQSQRNGASSLKKGNKRQKISQAITALAWPLKEEKALKLLQEVSRHKATITLALSADSSRDIKEVKSGVKAVQQTLTESEQRKFYQWLEVTNPSGLHIKATDLHEKDTGAWMLESKDWEGWIARRIRCLWLHGIPGTGKTVLASYLFDTALADSDSSEKVATVYYYCYFGHDQDETIPLLGWVISQLCRHTGKVPENLSSMYNKGRRPNTQQLLDGLADILKSLSHVYVVIDALDESKEPRDQILNVLKSLATESRFSKIQLLVTSREYFDIQFAMSSFSVSVAMHIDQVQADIRKYVCTTLRTNRRFSSWPEELRREVQDKLAVGAKGMFRWAVCQIDVLRRLSTIEDARTALSSLPETLDETYERIFEMVPAHERSIVNRALCLLCGHNQHGGSESPMSAKVLLSLVTGNWDQQPTAPRRQIFNVDMLEEACGCLVTISELKKVSLAHFTVKEFLFSERLWAVESAAVRFFALSSDLVDRAFLHTMLIGLQAYVGPVTKMPDSINDLYDYLILFGFHSLTRHSGRLWEWQLVPLILQVLAPQRPHLKRARVIFSKEWTQGEVTGLYHVLCQYVDWNQDPSQAAVESG